MTQDWTDSLESRLLPNQLVQMAAQAAAKGDVETARECCAQVLARDPYHEDALLWRSVVAQDGDEKIRLLRQVLAINPENRRAKLLLTWAESRQMRGEAASSSIEIECLTPCPYLGMAQDPDARFAYPCPGNVCYAEAGKRRPPRQLADDTQEEICLTVSHLACPTYCRVQATRKQRGLADLLGLGDYFDFFGLDEEPFTIVPIPRFFHPTRQHEEALRALRQVIDHHQGLAVLSAPVGMGKTLLLRTLYEQLFADARYTVGWIAHPNFRTEYALMWGVLQALRVAPRKKRSLHDLEDTLQRHVTERVLRARRTVVLLFDEAHQMGSRALNQLRKILDFHVDDTQMVQMVLAGQPLLLRNIARLPALQDRVIAAYTLSPLSPSDVKGLITARLHEAGSQNGIFTPAAVRAITDLTGGQPRRITVLCMKCLWEAFEQRRHVIDHDMVAKVMDGKAKPVPPQEQAERPARAEGNVFTRLRLLWHRDGSN